MKLRDTKFLDAALEAHKRGLEVIPVVPKVKKTAVSWDKWLAGLTEKKILDHWRRNPDHEVGFIVSKDMMVLDADTESAVAVMHEILSAFDIAPNLIVKTSRGQHVYLAIKPGTFVKTRAVSTTENPAGLDIKANRSLVILPPSTGKSYEVDEIEHIRELPVVDQTFIDAIYRHNGWPEPRPPKPPPSRSAVTPTAELEAIKRLLENIDPDCGYEDWLHVAMAISFETGNSEDGFRIFDAWSGIGSKYPGEAELRVKWRSFASPPGNPITIATLAKLANDSGADDALQLSNDEEFSDEDDTTVEVPIPKRPVNPLVRFSLTGSSAELSARIQDAVFVLLPVALLGQATVIFAAPNTGKTLSVLSLAGDSIAERRIDPRRVFYVNADDNLRGLTEKVRIAEELGFHVLADGYRDLRTDTVIGALRSMAELDTADGNILILDTLKRFTDPMHKRQTSDFTGHVRRFCLRGGTVIALAHTNKRRGDDGKRIFAGTSDIVDDFDCAYILDLVDDGQESGRRVISFENIKARGAVEELVHYSYLTRQQAGSYAAMVESFTQLDSKEMDEVGHKQQARQDEPLIATVVESLQKGPASKNDLQILLKGKHNVSRAVAAAVIERYCGEDPGSHRWTFTRGEHGRHQYQILDKKPAQNLREDLLTPSSVWAPATPSHQTREDSGNDQ